MGILSATMYLKTSWFEIQNFSDCRLFNKDVSMYHRFVGKDFFVPNQNTFKLDLLIIYFVAIFISCPIVER